MSFAPKWLVPDDPTLPKPWKGMICGITGSLYYWNTETNIVQHKRPASSPPLLLPNPPRSEEDDDDSFEDTEDYPEPITRFEDTGLPRVILQQIYSAGISSPTEIQAHTWPNALQGRDIVVVAKTDPVNPLDYLIPAFILLTNCQNNSQKDTKVLVLAPTCTHATQIQAEVLKFGKAFRVSCTCLSGGGSKDLQLKELDHGADIVVATPGPLNEILEMKKIYLGQVSLLVLDEADQMLDKGFEPQIRKIMNEIPPSRQTLIYTATLTLEVRKITSDLLVNPVLVNNGCVDARASNKFKTQHFEVVLQKDKNTRLKQIITSQHKGAKVLVFCSTTSSCVRLAATYFGAAVIHGGMAPDETYLVLNQFQSGESPILFTSDDVAFMLDIKDIRVVINYDFPTGVEDYVHRIVRTWRAGATGVSYSFFSEKDLKYGADLINVLKLANQQVPPELQKIALSGGPSFVKDEGGLRKYYCSNNWDCGGFAGMRHIDNFGGRGGIRNGNFGGHGRGRGDMKLVEEWVVPLRSVEDIHEIFKNFCLGNLRSSPWSELGVLQPETKKLLGRINLKGFLTINNQPTLNGCGAGPGEYVYQKAHVEFFCSKKKLDALVDKCKTLPSRTYIAMKRKGSWISNKRGEVANVVAWGVSPSKGMLEHTIIDRDSFIVWKDEAFKIWSSGWACLYPEGDSSRKLLQEVQNSYFFVSLVDHDYICNDLLAVFADF